MAHVERDIFIDAPADVIYDYAGEPANMPQWYVGIVGVNPDGVWPQSGGQTVITYQVSGVSFDVTATVLTHNPPHEFAFQMEGAVSGTSTWTYSQEEGGTRVHVAFDYELPGGVLGEVADKLVVEQMNISNGEQSLTNLKAVCEGG